MPMNKEAVFEQARTGKLWAGNLIPGHAPGDRLPNTTPIDNSLIGHIEAGKSRSEEHTSELQSLMRISYDVFCLKKTNIKINIKKLQQNNIIVNTTYNSTTRKIKN